MMKATAPTSNHEVIQGLYSPDAADKGFWALKVRVIFAKERKNDHKLQGEMVT